MTRLPPLPYDDADAAQRSVWDRVVATRGGIGPMTDETGSIVGPFHAMVSRPHVGQHLVAVGQALRFESAAEARLLEIAICTVGAHWKSEFEFWAHRRLAVDAGVDEQILDAIASGDEPVFDRSDEEGVYRYASSLLSSGHADQALYDRVVDDVGVDAIIDLTLTIGYYCQISFVLNAFAVPLPDGVDPTWPA